MKYFNREILQTFFSKYRLYILPLCVFFFAFSIRVPFYHTPFWRTPDAVEYINVARNIYDNKGLTLSIKSNFFEDTPVSTSATKGKPILTSVLLSLIMRLNNDFYTPQFFILLIGAINAVFFYFLASKFLTDTYAMLSSISMAMNPNILISNRLVISEFIAIFFILFLLLLFYYAKPTIFKFIFMGITVGCAYMTRLECLLLVPLIFYTIRKEKKYYIPFLISFILTALPYFLLNYQVNGNPFYTYNTYHFRVTDFSEGMERGFDTTFPSSINYIQNNLSTILGRISSLFIQNVKSLFDFDFFGLFIIPLSIFFFKYRKRFMIEIIFCCYIFLCYTLTWSAFVEPARGFMTMYVLLLIPVFLVLQNMKQKIALAIIGCMFIIHLGYDIHRVRWVRRVESNATRSTTIYNWVNENTKNTEIVATPDPWGMNLFTQRPSILLPKNLTNKTLVQFAEKYDVKYIFASSHDSFYAKYEKVYSYNNESLYCIINCRD